MDGLSMAALEGLHMTTTVIFGNIRLHEFTQAQKATLFSIFARIKATTTGAGLFNTQRLNDDGLDVCLTNSISHDGGRSGMPSFCAGVT